MIFLSKIEDSIDPIEIHQKYLCNHLILDRNRDRKNPWEHYIEYIGINLIGQNHGISLLRTYETDILKACQDAWTMKLAPVPPPAAEAADAKPAVRRELLLEAGSLRLQRQRWPRLRCNGKSSSRQR